MNENEPNSVGFKKSMLYVVGEGKVTVIVGWFPVGDDISSGVCFLDVDLDTVGQEVIVDYNFGDKKIVLKP